MDLLFCIDFIILGEICEPTYTLSSKGKCQLIHHGYKYNQNGEPTNKGTYLWRCGLTKNGRYACTAKASTYEREGIEYATFRGTHHHSPITQR